MLRLRCLRTPVGYVHLCSPSLSIISLSIVSHAHYVAPWCLGWQRVWRQGWLCWYWAWCPESDEHSFRLWVCGMLCIIKTAEMFRGWKGSFSSQLIKLATYPDSRKGAMRAWGNGIVWLRMGRGRSKTNDCFSTVLQQALLLLFMSVPWKMGFGDLAVHYSGLWDWKGKYLMRVRERSVCGSKSPHRLWGAASQPTPGWQGLVAEITVNLNMRVSVLPSSHLLKVAELFVLKYGEWVCLANAGFSESCRLSAWWI